MSTPAGLCAASTIESATSAALGLEVPTEDVPPVPFTPPPPLPTPPTPPTPPLDSLMPLLLLTGSRGRRSAMAVVQAVCASHCDYRQWCLRGRFCDLSPVWRRSGMFRAPSDLRPRTGIGRTA
ncbi:hypothetical protein CVN68_02745 [Sphingomonas psychrotolerans]|uniref:Uncharacterized protein n=1 Tax=Sphingomonas psychrotolerans TaxID=1327635 RepID=A0A2K8MAX4_9SPHN|nr:hypothetical protein CVN68_02745 [Sphingomonas psychrotolerans]